MTPRFITHPDFARVTPINTFFKEGAEKLPPETDQRYLNRHILFRRELQARRGGRYLLRITADDYYKLYVNGRLVTQGPAPSYPTSYYYNEVDITEYISKGKNIIAVHTYYQGLINRVWVSGDRRHMLCLELLKDGKTVLVSDESFRVSDHSGYTALGRIGYDTAFTECYDSRAPEVGFEMPDFDDTGWGYAQEYECADYSLIKQPTKNLDIYDVSPVAVIHRDDGIIYDFGQEMVGYISALAEGKAGEKITLRYSEELTDSGDVRHEMRCNCRYEEEWILSGGCDRLYQYDYKAFRYAKIICPEGVRLSSVTMTVRHYPYEERGSFTVPNKEAEKILDLCKSTIKYGTQEGFLDCPTREKGQYLGDLSISARAHTLLTRDTAMMRKAIRNFFDSAFICQGLMAVSTSSLNQEIADYSLQVPHQVLWIYKLDADADFVKSAVPYVLGMHEYFLKFRREDGLLAGLTEKWNLVDWPKNLRDGYAFPCDDEPHNVLNAFYVGFLKGLDEMLVIAGREPLSLWQRTEESFIKTFYDKTSGLYADNPQRSHFAVHSSIIALLFGIGCENERIKTRLIEHIYEKKLTRVGVYMAYFAISALTLAGRRDLAVELCLDEGCWLNMLKEGATCTFEAWGKEQKWNTSLFHPWATAPIMLFSDGTPIY